jgi:membrane protease YdiL (CAAX protease family)
MDIQSPPTAPQRRIAPLWHTIVLILVLGLFSFAGAKSGHPVARAGLAPQYISMIIFEWLAFGYVVWGIHMGGVLTVRQTIGGRWEKVEDLLLEIAIAAAFWIVSLVVLGGCAYLLGMTKGGANNIEEAKKILGFLAPRTALEVGLWILVALTAGFCEEFIFRGYMQRQFSAISGKVFVGMLVSSAVFGMAHGYEGMKRMVLICVYGFLFSSLAELRKSLRPGMMAHAWHDAFTGLVLRLLFK